MNALAICFTGGAILVVLSIIAAKLENITRALYRIRNVLGAEAAAAALERAREQGQEQT